MYSVLRFVLALLGAMWLFAGFLSFPVIASTQRDPDDPEKEFGAAHWALFFWACVVIVAMGPFGLRFAVELRADRLREVEARIARMRPQTVSHLVTWRALSDALLKASRERTMTRQMRRLYEDVAADLVEPPLAGRLCDGCRGRLLQRRVSGGALTFDYDCSCPGATPLDRTLSWEPVPIVPEDLVGGVHIEVRTVGALGKGEL